MCTCRPDANERVEVESRPGFGRAAPDPLRLRASRRRLRSRSRSHAVRTLSVRSCATLPGDQTGAPTPASRVVHPPSPCARARLRMRVSLQPTYEPRRIHTLREKAKRGAGVPVSPCRGPADTTRAT